MFDHDVGISLEYEDWNNNIRSPITCVVMVELVTCRGKVKDGTTYGWWRTNDVTRALSKVCTAQESNQCIIQMYVQADVQVHESMGCVDVFIYVCITALAQRRSIHILILRCSMCTV